MAGKERPILFSAPMVRALLAGTKTQTRRVVKPQPGACDHRHHNPGTPAEGPWNGKDGWHCATCGNGVRGERHKYTGLPCPYGAPGDTLWVKETWRMPDTFDGVSPTRAKGMVRAEMAPNVFYVADGSVRSAGAYTGAPGKTRVSIHMPRWASRITLRITDVRVERLNDCSEADARAEGIVQTRPADKDGWRHFGIPGLDVDQPTAARAYASLWDHINGPGPWAANPWVWAVSFERLPIALAQGSQHEH